MAINGSYIGIVSRDDNLTSVARGLLEGAGFKVEAFRNWAELLSHRGLNALNGLIVVGDREGSKGFMSDASLLEKIKDLPVIFLSTFEEDTPGHRFRTYPVTFSWNQVLSDLAELTGETGKEGVTPILEPRRTRKH